MFIDFTKCESTGKTVLVNKKQLIMILDFIKAYITEENVKPIE